MKKILTILTMTLMMAGLFAYEPNPECFEVNDDMIYYNEEVEPKYGGNGIRRFLTTGPISLEKEAGRYYRRIESTKNYADFCLEIIRITSTDEEKEEYRNKLENAIKRAIYEEIPFVTDKNFWTISKREYTKKFIKYLKKIQKEQLKEQEKQQQNE